MVVDDGTYMEPVTSNKAHYQDDDAMYEDIDDYLTSQPDPEGHRLALLSEEDENGTLFVIYFKMTFVTAGQVLFLIGNVGFILY